MAIIGGEAIDCYMEEIRNISTNNSHVSALTGLASAQEFDPAEWDLHLPKSKVSSYHSLPRNKRNEINSMVSR